MKILLCFCALVAVAFAGAPSTDYLPPLRNAASAPEPSFVAAPAPAPAPVVQAAPAPSYQVAASAPVSTYHAAPAPAPVHSFAASAPAPTYQAAPSAPAPVVQSAPVVAAASNYEVAASEPAPAHTLSSDGYRYKNHRRIVYRHRHRRDVSHLPSTDYLPPAASAPVPSNDYLPPHQGAASTQDVAYESAPAVAASSQHVNIAPAEPAPAHTFSSADGYRYKTHRRRVIRRRRY